MRKISLLIILISVSASIYVRAETSIRIFTGIKWYSQSQEAEKTYLKPGKFSKFSLKTHPDYNNRIINQIKRINTLRSDNISICSSASGTRTDLMFLEKKLFSIYQKIDRADGNLKDQIVRDITNAYGTPEKNDNAPYVTYTFKDGNTSVIIVSLRRGNLFELEIIYYASDIFEYMILY